MIHAFVAGACLLTLVAMQAPVPTDPIQFAGFSARFAPDGSFELSGPGWPAFRGTWKAARRDRDRDAERSRRLRQAGTLSRANGQRTHDAERRRRRLPVAEDDPRSQHLAPDRRQGSDPAAQHRAHGRRQRRPRCRRPPADRAAGRRSAGRRPAASATVPTCPTYGTAKRATTCAGRRRSPASRTRARSSGAIASS